MSKEDSKRDLANPKGPRSISDKLDSTLWKDGYKDTSCTRGIVHGVWHAGAGLIRSSDDEYKRAGEQFGKCGKFLTVHLSKIVDETVSILCWIQGNKKRKVKARSRQTDA